VYREKQAFPDLKMTVNLLVTQGDFVPIVWTFRGTHTGPGVGLPPTGARIAMRGITVWRIADGRIREEWTSYNELYQGREWRVRVPACVAMTSGQLRKTRLEASRFCKLM
jgi:SnoaL-like polyketide cyclase